MEPSATAAAGRRHGHTRLLRLTNVHRLHELNSSVACSIAPHLLEYIYIHITCQCRHFIATMMQQRRARGHVDGLNRQSLIRKKIQLTNQPLFLLLLHMLRSATIGWRQKKQPNPYNNRLQSPGFVEKSEADQQWESGIRLRSVFVGLVAGFPPSVQQRSQRSRLFGQCPLRPVESNLKPMLNLANEFDVEGLREKCMEFMRNCSKLSLMEQLELADRYHLEPLTSELIVRLASQRRRRPAECESAQYAHISDRTKVRLLEAIYNGVADHSESTKNTRSFGTLQAEIRTQFRQIAYTGPVLLFCQSVLSGRLVRSNSANVGHDRYCRQCGPTDRQHDRRRNGPVPSGRPSASGDHRGPQRIPTVESGLHDSLVGLDALHGRLRAPRFVDPVRGRKIVHARPLPALRPDADRPAGRRRSPTTARLDNPGRVQHAGRPDQSLHIGSSRLVAPSRSQSSPKRFSHHTRLLTCCHTAPVIRTQNDLTQK
ncbi:conserved hypothetical protein [Trichinella spiralis]|uniref:hypothetical protein n=1 Tax=Trichinella spiralis TaxID=6334 RepID=UPI0001EFC603|nr:conserved hypothetical protein [Trichinella spiralis]